MKCGTCHYYSKTSDSGEYGQCHRYPPVGEWPKGRITGKGPVPAGGSG